MKILLQTADDAELLFLAGDGRLGERVFSSVANFELTGELENQIVRRVRGKHASALSRGNVRHRAFFRTRRVFATAAQAENYATAAERNFPRTGTLYFVTGNGTRKLLHASVTPPATTVQGCEVRLQYQATGEEFTPLNPEFVLEGVQGLYHRVVLDSAERWFEVGFDSPVLLDGNAADGWTDPFGNLRFRFHRSENLTSWDFDWIPCPTSPETITGGYRYWARSKYPHDSQIKSGGIEVSSGALYGQPGSTPGNLSPDTRNNPFTSLTILGVSRALGGFPYTMPGDAARMQTDLAALFPGATVEASTATVWRIKIPLVTFSAFLQVNKVFWPTYLVADMFGVVNVPVSGGDFGGLFVNAAGVRTSLNKQFARLGVSAGPNYLY
jgi:hypothetical protein